MSRILLDHEGQTSRETSAMVGNRLAAGEALYQVEEPSLQAAEPDLILAQGLCEVCAPTLGDVEDVARRLPKRPDILSLDPHGLQDVFADIERVGARCGIPERADAIVASLRERVKRVTGRAARASERPKTVCIEWLDPLFLGGHWIPEMVNLAGGTDALGRPGAKSRRVEPKEIVMASPDVAVLMPCGFDLERTWKEAHCVTHQRWWTDLPAARTDRVWLVDGSAFFNRPGPRLVDGLEILAHILQPGLFPRAPRRTAAQRSVG